MGLEGEANPLAKSTADLQKITVAVAAGAVPASYSAQYALSLNLCSKPPKRVAL